FLARTRSSARQAAASWHELAAQPDKLQLLGTNSQLSPTSCSFLARTRSSARQAAATLHELEAQTDEPQHLGTNSQLSPTSCSFLARTRNSSGISHPKIIFTNDVKNRPPETSSH